MKRAFVYRGEIKGGSTPWRVLINIAGWPIMLASFDSWAEAMEAATRWVRW